MAKLQSDNLTLEIKFYRFESEWIGYKIKFYWKEDLIVNDNILKRTGEWWYKRDYGTFLANDYEGDHLIETIKKVLQTNETEYWEPIEPDVKIGIYPDIFFPFLKSQWVLVEEDGEKYMQKEKNENSKSLDKSPEDLFTIITLIDTYNFKDSGAYSGEGISLHLIVTRKDLEKFVTDLETEYNDLIKSDTYNSKIPF